MPRYRVLWLLLFPVLLAGACDGDVGPVHGQFSWDSSVTEMTLTGLNVDVENALPDADISYALALGPATILWQADGVSLSLEVVIKANPAITSEVIEVDLKTADGEDKNLLFEFAGDQLTILELTDTFTGTAF